MTMRTSLLGGAALGALLALAIAPAADAKTKHHHHVAAPAGDGVKGEIDGTFAADIDERIDAINRQHVSSGKYFRNTHSLALAYTPETGVNIRPW